MITRIEIDGFKTFHDFSLDLAPFEVIVGANGAGKSNLFDALRLLSRLADMDLRSAFQGMRGEAGELFTRFPDGTSCDVIRLAAELLIEPRVQDEYGKVEELRHTRLRYELEVVRQRDDKGLEHLRVRHEQLTALLRKTDAWFRRHVRARQSSRRPSVGGGRGTPFISTELVSGVPTLSLHQDGHQGRKVASVADRVERTILSGVPNAEFPHAYAAREELRSWRLLQLSPEALRSSSDLVAPQVMGPDGAYLPSALARMRSEDPYVMNAVSRDLANLVPGVTRVKVEEDRAKEQYVAWADTEDGRAFSSRVLSDGTLRLLALVALANDPSHCGVVCFEEPENGVHPFRLRNLIHILGDLSTDLADAGDTFPLRQLLVNTHSPVFVSEAVTDSREEQATGCEVVFCHMPTLVWPGGIPPLRVTRMSPVVLDQPTLAGTVPDGEAAYTLDQVIHFLESADPGEAVRALRQSGGC